MALTAHKKGSSPLTRGKLHTAPQTDDVPGLIPAHAGKTSRPRLRSRRRRAHPRSRGENQLGKRRVEGVKGSSPLTRGKPTRMASPVRMQGLIPAHAGKTRGVRRRSWVTRAHPRSRGENELKVIRAGSALGSSPLTRGKRVEIDNARFSVGLIPAHAGKTAAGY